MRELYPILIVGAVVGVLTAVFLVAFFSMKDKKEAIGFDRHMKDGEIIRRLLGYAKPYVWNFVLVLLLMVFSVSNSILSPLLIGDIERVVEAGQENFLLADLFLRVFAYVAILLVSQLSAYFQAIILQKTGQRILSAIREQTFAHIESFSHSQLNRIPVGKLVTRVTNDTNSLSMLFTNILVNLIKNIFVMIGVVAAMLLVHLELTLMVLCFAPFIALFTVIFRKFSRRAYRRVKDGTTDLNTFLSENLSGIKVTQIFNREARKFDEFEARNRKLGGAKEKEILVFAVFRPTVYLLNVCCVLFLFYLGGRGYIRGQGLLGAPILASTVVTFYLYISRFFEPIQSLAEHFNWMQSALASAEKIFTILDEKPAIVDAPDAIDLDRVEGNIEFRNVWFAYEGEEWILKDVSFRVNAKETVAFVGATGAGKTTILALICRNYEIARGQILLDGIDIRKIRVASLRRHFGEMLQDVFLFSGTIRSNIVLREEDIPDDRILEACRYVNADRLIDKLPGGLDEPVRERGNNFSAGQRQLLSFARTIVHRPEIMILDEATANIDTETEVLIQDSLEKMMNIGTMLMVAHRLSTIRHADRIIVLDHGQIVEQGSHADLLAAGGRYAELYKLQYEKQESAKAG